MKTPLISLLVLAALGLPAAAQLPAMPQERFVPASTRTAIVELRSDADVKGNQIKLGQVVRWPEADAWQMEQVADLVVAQFGPNQTTQAIGVEDLKSTLEGAGVNLATISFFGALTCAVTRTDVPHPGKPVDTVAQVQRLVANGPEDSAAASKVRTLREVLLADLAERIGVPADLFQVRFNGEDEKRVEMSGPGVEFTVTPSRIRKLGEMNWEVTVTELGKSRHMIVSGYARLWQNQLLTVRPLAYKQPIRDEDVVEKRVLVDRLESDPLLTRPQAVGQQAARDLPPSTVLTGRMIEAVTLVRPGQLITVLVEAGNVQVRWVAEARESGTYGQSVRVRKPGTREEFSVVLTGPQQGRLVGETSELPKVAVAGTDDQVNR